MSYKFTQRIIRAQSSSDLSEQLEDADVDVLRAVGMSGRLHSIGAGIVRALGSTRGESQGQLVADLHKALSIQYPMLSNLEAKAAAVIAIEQWLRPHCSACHGRGFELIEGAPKLSDVACGECHGSGKVQILVPKKIEPATVWAGSLIDREVDRFRSSVQRRLGR